jgi:hypothetical protein
MQPLSTESVTVKRNQTNAGLRRRLMYVENKDGTIDGVAARIGWVSFLKAGLSIRHRGRTFARANGGGISGSYFDTDTREEYWVSGVKKRGSNVHWAEPVRVIVDDDARQAYAEVRQRRKGRR